MGIESVRDALARVLIQLDLEIYHNMGAQNTLRLVEYGLTPGLIDLAAHDLDIITKLRDLLNILDATKISKLESLLDATTEGASGVELSVYGVKTEFVEFGTLADGFTQRMELIRAVGSNSTQSAVQLKPTRSTNGAIMIFVPGPDVPAADIASELICYAYSVGGNARRFAFIAGLNIGCVIDSTSIGDPLIVSPLPININVGVTNFASYSL